MATTHELITKLITQNSVVPEPVSRLTRFVFQKSVPNTAYCTADQTVVGTTLANSTYLQIANGVGLNGGAAVLGGRKYRLEGQLFVTSTASNGLKFDLNAGTATFSKVNGSLVGMTAAALVTSSPTTIATAFSSASTIVSASISVALESSGSGSIGLRFAESANSTGVIILQGSWLSLTEIAQ